MKIKYQYKMPKAKENELKIQYGQEKDNYPELYYCWGVNTDKTHSNMLISFFNRVKDINNKTLIEELEDLGYDLTTLKFSIQKKKT